MKKPLAIVLLIVLCIPLFACFSNVQAATQVSGLIKTDTTWRQFESPYRFTGSVCVANDVTLTIEPGVTVDFGEYYMLVNGTIHAQGSKDNQIIFSGTNSQSDQNAQVQFTGASTSWNNQTQTGCILQNIMFDKAVISLKDGCAPLIANNIFHGQTWVIIWAKDASPIITGNLFEDVYYEGISASRSTIVTENIFNKTTWKATAIVAHDNTYIANNVIIGFYIGISNGKTVKDNIILDCSEIGISGGYEVRHNYIANNKVGVSGSQVIEDNTIDNNEVGITASSSSVKNNNIANNKRSFEAFQSNINVAYNWWGTTNIEKIKEAIWDSEDDYTLGTVTFEPILSQPNSEAPSSDSLEETLSSIGNSSFNYFNYQTEADILTVTITIVTIIAVCWVIVAVMLVVKRFRR